MAQSYISNPLQMIRPSFEALKVNLGSLVLSYLLVGGVPAGILIIYAASHLAGRDSAVLNVFLFAALIVYIIFLILYFVAVPVVLLLRAAEGQKLTLKEAFTQARKFGPRVLWVSILTGLAVIGGLILLIIPGLIFAAWFSLAVFVAVEEDLKGMAALKRSKELVKGRVWEMWGLYSLSSVAGIFNIIPFVGWIVSLVFSIVMSPSVAIRYLQLKQARAAGEMPPIHPTNYWVIVAAAVVTILVSALGPRRSVVNQGLPTTYQLQ